MRICQSRLNMNYEPYETHLVLKTARLGCIDLYNKSLMGVSWCPTGFTEALKIFRDLWID